MRVIYYVTNNVQPCYCNPRNIKHPLYMVENYGYSKSHQTMIYVFLTKILGETVYLILLTRSWSFLRYDCDYITTGCGHTCFTAQLGLSRRWRAGHHRSYSSKLHGLHSLAQQHQALEQSTWHYSARAKLQWRNMLSPNPEHNDPTWPIAWNSRLF